MKHKKRNYIIQIIVCFLASIGLLIGGIFYSKSNNNFIDNGIKTQATITDIQFTRTGNSTNYYVLVEYGVDGVTYHNELGTYYAGMSEGQVIDIWYLKTDPNKITDASTTNTGPIIVYCFSGFMLLAAGIFVFISLNSKDLTNLKKTGTKVTYRVTHLVCNNNFAIGGSHPWKIYCENGSDKFVSHNIFGDLSGIQVGYLIDIYKSNVNKKYFIDLDSARADPNRITDKPFNS